VSVKRERVRLKHELGRLDKEAKSRQHEARRADSRKSKRHLDRHDSDGRGRIGLAIVTGKDGVAGKLASQMQARIQRCQTDLATLQVTPEYQLQFRLPGSISSRNHLLHLEAGQIALGPERTLSFPRLIMGTRDRIALVGPNGSGKSLLLSHLIPHLNVDHERLVYLPQEISLDRSRAVMQELRAQPRQQLGTIFSIISCLGSRPERLLESEQASPGEIRKVLLALGIAREPHLIIMDEPTNHLDLNAIELLEQALQGCPSAMLLISHDRRFLQNLTVSSWRIVSTGTDQQLVFDNEV